MKKMFAVINLFLFCFVSIGIQSTSSVNAQDQKKLILSQVDQIQADRNMAMTIRKKTNRTSSDLIEQRNSDGSVSVDLQGRYQNLVLGKLNAHNQVISGCVASLNEANSFFGKDLETGQILPYSSAPSTDLRKTAERHGMTKQEFLFYKDLIEKATQRRALSPNTATITIVNNDGAGEGFNDGTATAIEGGNNGATLGAQRLNVFDFAADIWEAFLDTNVTVEVRSQFDPLPCSPTSAVLGGASSTTVHRDFANAGFAQTWYPQSLANKQSGVDRSAQPDINATFNSQINGNAGCIGGQRFYLGLDNSTPGGTSNLLITVMHEIGHGLGFASFVDETNGTFFMGFTDPFTTFIFDNSTSKLWNDMTNAERQASAINNNNVHWNGSNVTIASGGLTNGRDAASGRVELFTPNPVQQGSSVSHYNIRAFPNLLMEPNITLNLPLDLDLTRQLMRDIGWYRDTTADVVPDTITGVTPSGGSIPIGTSATINWTNNGGFDRNVTVELSTDGGATYPTVLANDIANTGSTTFTVPNTPTNQAKVRVREHNFTEPIGESASNFTIGNVAAPNNVKFDFDGDSKTDVSIFRPGINPAQWWWLRSSDGGNNAVSFGLGTDSPTPADFTGDGKTDVAFFRESTNEWFVLRSEDNTFFGFPFGAAGDIPAPGDFDGDGKADATVYRPSTGTWFINRSSDQNTDIIGFGIAEDKPIVGDYDGDGMDDVAIYRPSVSQWWLNRSTDGVLVYQFGQTTDKTVTGDYTGDGKDDVAFWRPASGEWFVIRSKDQSFFSFPFGTATDIPVPGDYDGDGKQDAAVFRPTTSTWFIEGTTSGTQIVGFGASTDIPLANSFVRE